MNILSICDTFKHITQFDPMVNVNKKYLGEDQKEGAWRKFESKIKGSGNIKRALGKYLSPDEFAVFEKRLAIISMLEQGKTYLDIRYKLDASPSTVSFVKQGFKINKKTYKVSVSPIREFKHKQKKKFPRYKGTRGFGFSEW